MYLLALAADYDGTLAHDGRVDPATVDALERLKRSGRRLLLVTGRELPELESVFGDLSIFDIVVAENGALLFDPATRREKPLGPAPPRAFVDGLAARRAEPLSVGRVIVATREPHETDVLELIRDLGLELQIIFNKGAVMVLPSGISKATGLTAALDVLGLSPHNVVGVGDAENDHAFMMQCGVAAAVSNALPMLKDEATVVLEEPRGAGVVELIERMLTDEAGLIVPARHGIPLGQARDGDEFLLAPHAGPVLITGTRATDRARLLTNLLSRMAGSGFEYCVLDPNGEHAGLESAVAIGDRRTPPSVDETVALLDRVGTNVVVDLQACGVHQRPDLVAELLRRVETLRAGCGRPHWLLIDDAHRLMPSGQDRPIWAPTGESAGTVLVSEDIDSVSRDALRALAHVVALGDGKRAIEAVCEAIGMPSPACPATGRDEAICWAVGRPEPPRAVKLD